MRTEEVVEHALAKRGLRGADRLDAELLEGRLEDRETPRPAPQFLSTYFFAEPTHLNSFEWRGREGLEEFWTLPCLLILLLALGALFTPSMRWCSTGSTRARPFERPVFRPAAPLTDLDVVELTTRLHRRILRYLTRCGRLPRSEHDEDELQPDEPLLAEL